MFLFGLDLIFKKTGAYAGAWPFRFYRLAIFIILAFFIFYSTSLSFFQYREWQIDSFMRYSLPPYKDLGKFYLGYSYQHFIKIPLWRLIGAGLIIFLMGLLTKLFQGRFFYREEFYFLFFAGLLIDFPLNLGLFVFGLILLVVGQFWSIINKRRSGFERVSLRNFWLGLILIFIPLNFYLNQFYWFVRIKP